MSKLFASKRWIAIVGITAALVLASGGAAYAYFTTSGSGNGTADIGSAGTWTVTQDGSPSGDMYPGAGSSVITFSVTNNSSGDEQYSSATPTVNSDLSGNILQSSTPVTGCLAAWFTAVVTPNGDPHLGEDVGPGNTVQVTVKVTMPADANDDQTICAGSEPTVNLAIS